MLFRSKDDAEKQLVRMLITLEAGGFITLEPPPPKASTSLVDSKTPEGPVFHSVRARDVTSELLPAFTTATVSVRDSRWVSSHLAPMADEDSAAGEDGQQKNEKIEVDRNLEMEVLKKMKNGNLDPSKNLPIDAYEIAKNISLSNANSSSPHTDTSNMKKLMRMLQLILLADDMRLNSNGDKQKWFDSVKLNLDGTKLIFRSKDILNAEAFCFIVWGHKNKDNVDGKNDEIDGMNDRLDHSAVVQCENEDFRGIVIEALQLIQ